MSPLDRQRLRYDVPRELLVRTQSLLRDAGEAGREGYVVWVGELTSRGGHVSDVWPVVSEAGAGHAHATFTDVLALATRLDHKSWFLLAQIHSHPSSAFHSAIDDAHPISHLPGFISIVVPNFARGSAGEGWRVYEYLGNGRFRPIGRAEAARRIFAGRPWWTRMVSAITGPRSS